MTENKEEVEILKTKANVLFGEKKYGEAIEVYSKAIEINDNAILRANRAYSWLKLCHFQNAIEDATKSIQFDSNYFKGFNFHSFQFFTFLFC